MVAFEKGMSCHSAEELLQLFIDEKTVMIRGAEMRK